MNFIRNHGMECGIVMMTLLLILQLLLPPFLHTGVYLCLLILLIMTILLHRLQSLHEHLHEWEEYYETSISRR